MYYKKTIVLVWPGAAHALIVVGPQVYSVQQMLCAELYRLKFGRRGPKNLFLSKNRERPCLGLAVNKIAVGYTARQFVQ